MQTYDYALSPAHRERVKSSWQHVVPIAGQAADIFYERLFAANPAIAVMFRRTDMREQKNKLIHALCAVVDSLERLEDMFPLLAELGQRHTGYGVQPAHYQQVGAALIETLEAGLAERWTEELKEAWIALYEIVSGVMQSGAVVQPGTARA